MPIYECLTTKGTLEPSQRQRIAEQITAIHQEETGAPGDFIHVVFPELAEGHSYTAGRAAHPAIIRAHVRAGRPQSVREAMLRRIFAAYREITGASEMSILVALIDVPASWAMEGGMILPEPNKADENAWFEKIAERKAHA
jgi:phenylpyruvate tautomerase PptA (4-oxalocrotonate tautomerase family)